MPMGPSPLLASSQVMKITPPCWYALDLRIVGRFRASHRSPCAIGSPEQPSCMLSQTLGVMKLYLATFLEFKSRASSVNGRTCLMQLAEGGLRWLVTSSK